MTLQEEEGKAATLVELAVSQLRRDIITGAFAPASRLRIDDLRNNYDIGASPLREALSRLMSDGLVTAQGQRGFRVAPVSKADIRDITDTRKLLEHAVLRQSLNNGGPDWEADVVAAYERLDAEHETLRRTNGASVDAWEQANYAFHEALVSACESKWLRHFRQVVYDQALRYRRMVALDEEQERGAEREHREMFEAALARDADKSCELADAHAERTYNLMAARFSD